MELEDSPESQFSVFLLGRAGLVYEQNGMLACVDGEGLTGQPCRYAIVADSITQWDYPVQTPIDSEGRRSIIEHIRAKFKREGCELVVENKGYDPKVAAAYHQRIAGLMMREFERSYGSPPGEPIPYEQLDKPHYSRSAVARRYRKFAIAMGLAQAILIAAVLVWYAYQEFILGNFDAFLQAQLAMVIVNPLVRVLMFISQVRTWLWALAGAPLVGQVGQFAFALHGLLFMLLVDLVAGPLSTFLLLYRVVPRFIPKLRLPQAK